MPCLSNAKHVKQAKHESMQNMHKKKGAMLDRSELDRIKTRVNIIDIVGKDTTFTESARSYGGTYKGACPWCGGVNRFHVHLVDGNWWCRQCNRKGSDAIAYWQQRYNCDFVTAVNMLKAVVGCDLAEDPAPSLAPEPELVSKTPAGLSYDEVWTAIDCPSEDWPIDVSGFQYRNPGALLYAAGIQVPVSFEPAQDGWLVKFPYNADLLEDLKMLPGHARRWDKDSKAWWISWLYIRGLFDLITGYR